MDSPVRLQLKRNDYLRHKLFRKINRRRRAKHQLDIEAPVKELKKRLRLKRTFEDGKDGEELVKLPEVRVDDLGNVISDDGRRGTVRLSDVVAYANPDDIARGRAKQWVEEFGTTIEEQKQNNKRERNIAKEYFASAPTIGNIFNGLRHLYNSIPYLGGERENGLEYNTGITPTPTIKNPKELVKTAKNIRATLQAAKAPEQWTSAQWTAAQDAAIARGDMAEAQRLRDLHFKVSAPNTKIDIPLWTSSEEPFNSFDLRHFGRTDNGFFGYGHYMTPIEDYAASYHPVNRKFYVNVQNPYIGDNDAYFNRINYVKDRLARRKEGVLRDLNKGRVQGIGKSLGITENTSLEEANRILDRYVADETIKWNNKYVKYADEFKGKDGVLSWRDIQGVPNKREGIYKEVVVPRGEQIKSADAITYDDKGIRIPLGERDNFNLNDIRYGLLPLGIGLTGYSLSNYANGKDPGIHIKPENRGKFTRLKKRTGHSTAWFKAHGTPAQKKMATFAQNAKKWHH